MFNNDKNKLKYSDDLKIKKIKDNALIVISYLFILFVWQYTLSFQSSMFTLMNSCVFVMLAFGTAGLFICHEERENIIKHTKQQIIYYLLIVFVYDMFFKVVLNDMTISASLGQVDATLVTASNFIRTMSTMLKIGFPIAYVTWMLQKFGIFKGRITKRKAMEELRNVRENDKNKLGSNEPNIDRY